MINSFYGLELARRATNAFQTGLQTAGHNVANAQTEGYSRQRVNLATTAAYTMPGLSSPVSPGQIGTGVKISEITRVRDAFLDFQYRQEMSPLGYWSQIKRAYNNIEMFVAEPKSPGISAALDDFWASLQELSKNPDSSPIRESVIQQAKTFGTLLDQFTSNMDKFSTQINSEVSYGVDEVNTMLKKVAALNKTIAQLEAGGMNPNDLYDERDLLVDKISQKINITVKPPCALNDEYVIDLNGKNLVQGDRVRLLVAHKFLWDGQEFYNVQVQDNEFDIVDNCSVADVLPGGPDGAHQLNISRLASENAWKLGGGNAYCLVDKTTTYTQLQLAAMTNTYLENGVPVATAIATGKDVTVAAGSILHNTTTGKPVPNMRVSLRTANEPASITGSFRIQVGNSGVLARSLNLVGTAPNRSGVPDGQVLGAGTTGESYTFRVAAGGFERNITAAWNGAEWNISDDVGTPAVGVGATLNLSNISTFLQKSLAGGGAETFSIEENLTNGIVTQIGIKSEENWLISIVDVDGDLAKKMGLSNDSREGSSPVMTIKVETGDSLQTICNKINELFSISGNLTSAEQWVHAVVAYDANEEAYITIESNVIGESNRINILGDEDGNLQVLRRLGFVDTEYYGTDGGTPPVDLYREVVNVLNRAQDASFTFDGRQYLSDSNMFKDARRVPFGGNDYSAKITEEVSLGLRFKLKSVGQTGILVLNHVTNGELRALQDARDKIIPGFNDMFDEMIYNLVNEFNAIQYAGYGIGDAANLTGTGFFNSIGGKYGASKRFALNDEIVKNISLIGAAIGKGDGTSSGIGSGANALLMAQLKHSKILSNDSADFNAYYESFIAKLGAQSTEARSLDRNQNFLVTSIQTERLSVMGVNIDEEMLDIMQYTQAFNAIARYMNAVDEMLDRLINGFGLVGR